MRISYDYTFFVYLEQNLEFFSWIYNLLSGIFDWALVILKECLECFFLLPTAVIKSLFLDFSIHDAIGVINLGTEEHGWILLILLFAIFTWVKAWENDYSLFEISRTFCLPVLLYIIGICCGFGLFMCLTIVLVLILQLSILSHIASWDALF